ncbi:hypothetical protein ACH4YO_25155 [Streptomyces noursei]|uniref:hypothetical protein n=1 Tax=Streptomyces noursei TaxID=1971 RepID=UPI003799B983
MTLPNTPPATPHPPHPTRPGRRTTGRTHPPPADHGVHHYSAIACNPIPQADVC